MNIKSKLYKITVIVLIVLIVSLCFLPLFTKNKSKSVPKNISNSFTKAFNAQATIKMKDLVLQADVNKTSANELTMVIKSPATLKDMKFAYDGNNILVTFKGLSVNLDENSKLVQNALNIIVKTINSASSSSGINVGMEEGVLTVSGDSEVGKFKTVLDKKNGSIVSINVPSLDFECNFDV
ncbi:MAG: hypothetical protein RSA79_06505 [Oscillospiraceae bacterium]